MIPETKPTKKKKKEKTEDEITQKDQAESDEITRKQLKKGLKILAKIASKEKLKTLEEVKEPMITEDEPKIEAQEEKEDLAVLRCPSPSRSRQSSPKKREEKSSTPLKATADEFVPPGFSPPPKVTTSLQASAAEFVPPGFDLSLQASATELAHHFEPEVSEP